LSDKLGIYRFGEFWQVFNPKSRHVFMSAIKPDSIFIVIALQTRAGAFTGSKRKGRIPEVKGSLTNRV
jgi:hypothetical protein